MNKGKVIILDGGFYCHKAIFSYLGIMKKEIKNECIKLKSDYNEEIDTQVFDQAKENIENAVASMDKWISPSDYTYFQIMISDLKKIGVNKEDLIIVACDGRNSWRKAFLPKYKGQRAGNRAKHAKIIDWPTEYKKIEEINKKLIVSTNWNFIEFNLIYDFVDLYFSEEGQKFDINKHKDIFIDSKFSIEADDTQAYAVRYFKDKEVVLVTIDEDLDQLYYYDNCKIFNPNTKSPTNKSKKGFYNIVENPLQVLNGKVKKGDVSDNIIVDKHNDTAYDHEIRELIINLLKMPDFIEDEVEKALKEVDYNKQICDDLLPFKNSLGKRFRGIYDSNNIVTMEQSIKRFEDKKLIDANKSKIAYQKSKAKRIAKKEKNFR